MHVSPPTWVLAQLLVSVLPHPRSNAHPVNGCYQQCGLFDPVEPRSKLGQIKVRDNRNHKWLHLVLLCRTWFWGRPFEYLVWIARFQPAPHCALHLNRSTVSPAGLAHPGALQRERCVPWPGSEGFDPSREDWRMTSPRPPCVPRNQGTHPQKHVG